MNNIIHFTGGQPIRPPKPLSTIVVVMKLVILLTMAFTFQLSAKVYPQTISITAKDQPLEKIMQEIRSQSGYNIFFNANVLRRAKKVTVSVENATLEKALQTILRDQPVNYQIKGRSILLRLSANRQIAAVPLRKTQQFPVRGKVMDTTGAPLPGVVIEIKGSDSQGSITDNDGMYYLEGVTETTVLVFRMLGFQEEERPVGSQRVINITLKMARSRLNEALVIGYGTIKKSDLTGSVSSVKGATVTNVSSGSIEKLLQGRLSGLTVINNSDDNPKGGATLRVRGVSSINGSNAPLVVVDGVPIGGAGNITSINPNIIESIELLKDASGTAIYGSRGANGVIMITTKSGLGSTPSIWANLKTGVSMFSRDLSYWKDPLLMAKLSNESYENAAVEPLYVGKRNTEGVYYPSIEEIESGSWPYHTDWKDYIFRTAVTQDYNVGIAGETDKNRYYASLSHYRGQGMQNKDDYNKTSLDLSYFTRISEAFSIMTKAGLVKGNRNLNYGMNYNRNPLFPVFNGDGTYFKSHAQDYGNPIMMTNERRNVQEDITGYANIKFEWSVLPDLKLSSSANVRGGNGSTAFYNPPVYTNGGDFYNGEGGVSSSSNYTLISDSYLSYQPELGEKHMFSSMLGASIETNRTKGTHLTGRGFPNHVLKEQVIQGAETILGRSEQVEASLLSYFTRLNYTFSDRYLLTFTARADGSSKFGKSNKWGYFPSAAAGWRISQERFMQTLTFVDHLKFRASYGLSGNQGISSYQSLEQFGSSFYYTHGEEQSIYGVGKEIGREGLDNRYALWGGMGNADLGWEKTAQLDLGIDLSLFNYRVDVTFDYYRKRTTDLLRQRFLPPSAGYDRVWVNDGVILNQGVELAIDSRLFSARPWSLNAGLIFNRNRNQVISFGTKEDSGYIEAGGVQFLPYGSDVLYSPYLNVLAMGYPVNSFLGYIVDGIIQEAPESATQALTQPGEFNYIGLDENGVLDPNQRTIIGDPNPDFTGSLRFELRHANGLGLSVLLYGSFGNDIFSLRKLNSPVLQEQRWTPENPTNARPSLRSNRLTYASTWFVEDGSFLRVQNVTLDYAPPATTLLSRSLTLNIFLGITNPLTFSNVSEYDPEVSEKGIGQVPYPRTCTFTTGLEVKF